MRKFRESEEKYNTTKSVPTQEPNFAGGVQKGALRFPVYVETKVDNPSTPRRGSGAQTKARFAKGPMA